MFHYELRVARKRSTGGGGRRTTVNTDYMEALKPSYVGERVAALLATRDVKRVTVAPISQAAYVKATRGGE